MLLAFVVAASYTHSLALSSCFDCCLVDSGKFELKGASYPGIVHRVTSVLSKHGLSIETMGTTEEIAPYGGTCLFKMHGIAHAFEPLPKTFDSSQIREELRDLGNDLNCDLTLEDVEEESFSKTFYGTS